MDWTVDFFAALRRTKARTAAPGAAQMASIAPCGKVPAAPVAPTGPVRSAAMLEAGEQGLDLIRRFEGCARRRSDGHFEAYPDPGSNLARTGSGSGDPWTIGWGATGAEVTPATVWTQAQCDDRLVRDLARFAAEVLLAIGEAPTSQSQFDALVSFHYNTGAIARASLTRLHKAGDFAAAEREFGKWIYAGGKRLSGLARRRAAEAELYRSGSRSLVDER